MSKQSHYKVGCDAHPGPARQGGQALLALRRSRSPRQARRADPGQPRTRRYPGFRLPLPARHACRPGNRGQLVLDRG
jgi:hypothetical protein